MQAYWLIEVGQPAIYYCGPSDWCGNVNHAVKFHGEEIARATVDAIYALIRGQELVGGPMRVVEHAWVD